MRYLDREPRAQDRVWFGCEATYLRQDPDGTHRISLTGLHGVLLSVSSGDLVGVIAPEPAVGDVVTEDMDLPEGSIIECNNGGYIGVCCMTEGGQWIANSYTPSNPQFASGGWRIVRIGGAS